MSENPKKEGRDWGAVFSNTSLILSMLVALYFMYQSHQTTMKNAQKTAELLSKYEHMLDNAIANNETTLANYQRNVKKLTQSMSEEEKKLLSLVLNASETK